MTGARDEAARDEAMPYGVDTIRLRITWPAAPVSQGYNGRMRPLRGWTGGQEAGVPRPDGEAIAPSALAGGSDTVEAPYSRMLDDGLVQEAQPVPGVQYAQRGPPKRMRPPGGPGEGPLSDAELLRLELHGTLRSQLKEIDPENPELRKPYLSEQGGFVPSEADLDGLRQVLGDARSRRPPPQRPVNTFEIPGRPGSSSDAQTFYQES
jgi:hypothetical protein